MQKNLPGRVCVSLSTGVILSRCVAHCVSLAVCLSVASHWTDSDVIVDMDENSHPHHPSKMFRAVPVGQTRLEDLQAANTHLTPARQLLYLLCESKHVYQTLQQYHAELCRCYVDLVSDCSKVDCSNNDGASFCLLLAQQGAIGLTVEICKKIVNCSEELSLTEMEQLIQGPMGFLAAVCAVYLHSYDQGCCVRSAAVGCTGCTACLPACCCGQ